MSITVVLRSASEYYVVAGGPSGIFYAGEPQIPDNLIFTEKLASYGLNSSRAVFDMSAAEDTSVYIDNIEMRYADNDIFLMSDELQYPESDEVNYRFNVITEGAGGEISFALQSGLPREYLKGDGCKAD